MKSKDVLKILQCTRSTLCKYVKEQKIKVNKLSNGYYNYNENDVYKIYYGNNRNICILMQNDLELNELQNYCNNHNYKNIKIYKISQLFDLLDNVLNYSINKIILKSNCLNDDTYLLFKYVCNKFNTTIIEVI